MTYELEKKIWTDSDFDKMGWHDNQIYKMRLTDDLEMDIDYIVKWNQPDLEGLPFTFWVAPATLVFKNIRNLRFEFSIGFENSFEIEDIIRANKNQWTVITRQGDIQFASEGFVQFIRQDPSFQFGQTISYVERYGYSLDRVTNQENPNLFRDDIIEKRKKDLKDYENVKRRHLKKQELEELIKSRDNNTIDTKKYLLKKKEINELLFSYDFFLKGTQFESW
ncbi:hypothetical protein QTN47_25495 [Danxiaibacter flavus]|uniref:Uncharacterized protein n=1 Tax=Danxiaibacter flavus TaxID=3049108 RepID=A0ABV3ZQ14_9BACT|nr:hypothetical protein QNM32_25500 [Chitinophagaceae bacterium DXS]